MFTRRCAPWLAATRANSAIRSWLMRIITEVTVTGTPFQRRHHGLPVPRPPKRVVLGFRGEVERELDVVELPDDRVRERLDAEPVGRDARFDAALPEMLEDGRIFRMQAVLADAEVDRANRNGRAHRLHNLQAQPVDHHVWPVAMRTPEVALVRQTQADRERHRAPLTGRPSVKIGRLLEAVSFRVPFLVSAVHHHDSPEP